MFPVWNQDDRLLAKDEVLGVVLDDAKKAYPVNLFQKSASSMTQSETPTSYSSHPARCPMAACSIAET